VVKLTALIPFVSVRNLGSDSFSAKISSQNARNFHFDTKKLLNSRGYLEREVKSSHCETLIQGNRTAIPIFVAVLEVAERSFWLEVPTSCSGMKCLQRGFLICIASAIGTNSVKLGPRVFLRSIS